MITKSSRLARSIRLLAYLRANPNATASSIASEFNVSRRTVFRDINLLSNAGVEVTWINESGRYRVSMPQGFDQVPVLDRSELVALLALAHQSPLYTNRVLGPLARRAMMKLMGAQADELQLELNNLLHSLSELRRRNLKTIGTALHPQRYPPRKPR